MLGKIAGDAKLLKNRGGVETFCWLQWGPNGERKVKLEHSHRFWGQITLKSEHFTRQSGKDRDLLKGQFTRASAIEEGAKMRPRGIIVKETQGELANGHISAAHTKPSVLSFLER